MKVRYGRIALLLVGILIVSLGITALCGVRRKPPQDERVEVVAAFYPMYTAALRVAGDSSGVSVRCLTPPSTGCLHDHQLTPAERATLDGADVLILNGAGAEEFLDPLLPQLAATVVDTAAWAISDEEHHEHDEHGHDHNNHIWLDPALYAIQVKAIGEALCTVDPVNAEQYRQNVAAYTAQIAAVGEQLGDMTSHLAVDKAVLFHDSMVYPAAVLGLDVVGKLPIGEEDGFSAAEVAEVAEAMRGQAVLMLYDDQYPQQMTQLAAYAERSITVSLNSAVMPVYGVEDAQTWLWCMKENIRRLKEAAG